MQVLYSMPVYHALLGRDIAVRAGLHGAEANARRHAARTAAHV